MKNNNNIISIGLPCYNEEKNIIDVINKLISALNENFFSWEIIVVDNCSTDKTLEILENFLIYSLNINVILVFLSFYWLSVSIYIKTILTLIKLMVNFSAQKF